MSTASRSRAARWSSQSRKRADRLRRVVAVRAWPRVLAAAMLMLVSWRLAACSTPCGCKEHRAEHATPAMLDLGTSFLASVARDPTRSRSSMASVRLTYARVVPADFRAGRGLRRAGAQARRPSRHRAAEPLGGGDHPLGLPVRRHHHHAAELALDRRRARLLPRRTPRPRRSSTRRCRPKRCGLRKARSTHAADRGRACRRRHRLRDAGRTATRRDVAAARRRRGLVGDALHLRHHRASPRACRAASAPSAPRRSPMWRRISTARRAHARRHAALSHHGRALAAGDVADRRRVRLPAALRRRRARWS